MKMCDTNLCLFNDKKPQDIVCIASVLPTCCLILNPADPHLLMLNHFSLHCFTSFLSAHLHSGQFKSISNTNYISEHGERGGPPPPFGTPGGPPFGAPGGPPRFGAHTQGRFPADDHAPGFNGPPGGPGGFRNGPPPFPNGGPSFRDGPPPPFGVDNEGGGGPSFGGQDFGMRGGRGSFWRGARGGRGGPPVGRGGFRDRGSEPSQISYTLPSSTSMLPKCENYFLLVSGVWMDEGAPGGPDGFEGFPPSNER